MGRCVYLVGTCNFRDSENNLLAFETLDWKEIFLGDGVEDFFVNGRDVDILLWSLNS